MKVSLYHPVLDRQIEVHERTVPIHEKAGWRRDRYNTGPKAPDPETEPETETSSPAPLGALTTRRPLAIPPGAFFASPRRTT